MTLTYDLSIEDLVAYYVFCQQKSPSIRRRVRLERTLGFVVFPLAVSAALYIFVQDRAISITAIICIILASAIRFYGYPSRVKRRSEKYIRKVLNENDPSYMVGRHKLQTTDQGITTTSTGRRASYSWKSLLRLDVDIKHIYVDCGGTAAIVIPRSSFRSVNEQNAFTREVEAMIAASRKTIQDP